MSVTLGDKSDTSQFVFRKGESFTAVVYSNTAGTIRGNVRVVYDDRYVTREETPPTLDHFIRQRTRWSQGFLQTLMKRAWRRYSR